MYEVIFIKIAIAAIAACRQEQAKILAGGPSVISKAQVEAIQLALVAVLEALVELRDAECPATVQSSARRNVARN